MQTQTPSSKRRQNFETWYLQFSNLALMKVCCFCVFDILSYHYQGGIDFNTVNIHGTEGIYFLIFRSTEIIFSQYTLCSPGSVLNPYTAERRDVLENTPPRPKRFPKGGNFAPRGPRPKPEGNLKGRGVQNPRPREILRAEGVYFPIHLSSR